MLIWLFIIFITLGVLFSFIGFFADIPLFAMIGTILIFLMGLNLINEPLTYPIGETELYQYGNNFTGYHWDYDTGVPPSSSTDVFLFHTNTTPIYESYDDADTNRIGVLLIGLGALAFCLSLFML